MIMTTTVIVYVLMFFKVGLTTYDKIPNLTRKSHDEGKEHMNEGEYS